MTKAEEILEKHLKNNIDQRLYLLSSKLTYNLCLDAMNEAINFIPCCANKKEKPKAPSNRIVNNTRPVADSKKA